MDKVQDDMKVPASVLAEHTEVNDESIITRVLAGERSLYEVLVRRYNAKLYRVARGILKDDAEVEDAMQEAYVKAFENLKQFEGRSQFSTWLTRILINESLARFRKLHKLNYLNLDNVRDEDLLENEDIGFEEIKNTALVKPDIRDIIEKAIDDLPAKYRSAFILREMENMSIAEMSYCLGISEENVKVRIFRAKLMLRELLTSKHDLADLFGFHKRRCNAVTEKVMSRIL